MVSNDWALTSLGVKAAFIQAEGFEREVWVVPPECSLEANTPDEAWLLLKPAYGLPDSGNLWHNTSSRHLQKFGVTYSWSNLLQLKVLQISLLNNVQTVASIRLRVERELRIDWTSSPIDATVWKLKNKAGMSLPAIVVNDA